MSRCEVAEVAGRFECYVGLVSPPASFDCSPQHLLDAAGQGLGVVQHICHVDGFVYGEDEAVSNLAALETGVAALAAAEAEIVAQVGAYWALSFTPRERNARDLAARLSDTYGVDVVLVWNALVDALRRLDARRITVATGYYRPDWTARVTTFLEDAGFEIAWIGDLVDQGIVADEAAKIAIEQQTRWDYPDAMVRRVCVEAHRCAPHADAVVQCGAGMRPAVQAADIEAEIGRPLVSTDIALYWAVLDAARFAAREGAGQLLETTRRGARNLVG